MKSFLTRHDAEVKGTLSGFDRVRFRGTLRWLANVRGLGAWLYRAGVLLKSFKDYAMGLTDKVRETTKRLADEAGRPVQYVASSSQRKEDLAREIADRDGIVSGLVCVLTCVEPCLTFTVGPNRAKKQLELRSINGKCLHQYFYLIDPKMGWLNVRVQTWFPFTVHVVMNGREWLSRELQREQIPFQQRENCFVDIADIPRAQKLMDRQCKTNWSRELNRLLQEVHPAHRTLFGDDQLHYYWSADETEWATDVMFRSEAALARLYPRLVRHAVTTFGGNDVLKFLGRRSTVKQFSSAELTTHLGTRAEGTRIKHQLNRNSVKMYDKQGSVLRVETTINNARQMKSYRASESDPDGPKSWKRMRKGVADLYHRTEISQKCNERYLEALGAVDCETTLAESAASVCRRTKWKGRPVRALNPLAEPDAKLLQAVSRGEFTINGFRNRDLREILFASDEGLTEKQQMTRVTRAVRLLRAHRLIRKVPKTHRYTLTSRGRESITALLTARAASVQQLTKLAA